MWAPSHVGIRGNEAVDKLTQDAILNLNKSSLEELHYSDLHSAQGELQTER